MSPLFLWIKFAYKKKLSSFPDSFIDKCSLYLFHNKLQVLK